MILFFTMTKIKFGTDGWRAIIALDFTVDNVARVTEATAKWMLKQQKNPTVVLGHDCRFAGELFADSPTRCRLELPRDLPALPLPPDPA